MSRVTRSEALNLLQVLLLDERQVPPLKAPTLLGRHRRLMKKTTGEKTHPVSHDRLEADGTTTSSKGRLLL